MHKVFDVDFSFVGVIASIPSAIYFGSLIECVLPNEQLRWFRWLGTKTIYIYILHVPILQVVFMFFNLGMFHSIFESKTGFTLFMAIYPILFVLISTTLSIVIGTYLSRVFPILFVAPKFAGSKN